MHLTPNDADTLVNIATVVDMLQRSRASIYRDIAQGAFPKAVKLGSSSRWLRSEIAAHIEVRPMNRVGTPISRPSTV